MVNLNARRGLAPMLSPGISFMPPAGLAPSPPVRRQPTFNRGGGAPSVADAIRARNKPLTAPGDDGGGLKENAVRGLGWVIGNPVSRTLLKPLDVLDYGRATIGGSVRQLLDTEVMQDLNQAVADYTPLKFSPIDNPDYDPGWDWGELWEDIKRREGGGTSVIEPAFGPEGTDRNIWVRRGLGFAFDLATDPLMRASTGTRALSGTENRINYLNKLQDAQNAARIESTAAREAAEFAAEHALLGGTGAEAATQATRESAEQAQRYLNELTQIGGKDAASVVGRRGVNVATPTQLAAMGAPQHALRMAGVPIEEMAAGLFGARAGQAVSRLSEPASRAMSRFLSPAKEAWTQTVGRQGRKLVTPLGKQGQVLGPATERILTGRGAQTMETALRTHATNQMMRLAQGNVRSAGRQFLGQLDEALKGMSKDERAALVQAAEEQGVENAVTAMAPQMVETLKEVYRKAGIPEDQLDQIVPELKPWMLANGNMSRYVMPHVLSRDAFRFFNRLRKGDNPLLDLFRRDIGVTDKDLLEEGGFLQRRLFRPNADGSPQAFKIGDAEITIETGSVAELEEKLGGLLRQHGFEGNLYETNPTEAWRRYILSVERDVGRNVAIARGATEFGLKGLRAKPKAPHGWDPFGREVEMVPAAGETEPRYVRGKSTTQRPALDEAYEWVPDEEATKARDAIITQGGAKGTTAQVVGEFEETAAATRENLAQSIENTRQYTEDAFKQAREKAGRRVVKLEAIVTKARAKVDKLETEYRELLKEASANEELIAAKRGTIHGIRSQTPKRVKAAVQARLDQIGEELAHHRARLDAMQRGLQAALDADDQLLAQQTIDKVAKLDDAVTSAESHLNSQLQRARQQLNRRLAGDKRIAGAEGTGVDHLITESERNAARDVLNDPEAAERAQELMSRLQKQQATQQETRRAALAAQEQADRLDEQLSRRTGGTAPRSEQRQARMEAGRQEMRDEVKRLRREARTMQNRSDAATRQMRETEARIKSDEWLKAKRVSDAYDDQQAQIQNFLSPRGDIDVRGAQSRLAEARRKQSEFAAERTADDAAKAAAAPLKPIKSLEEILGPGHEPKFETIPGDDSLLEFLPPEEAKWAGEMHRVSVWTPDGDPIGSMVWSAVDGEVMEVRVLPQYRRRGIALALADEARQYAERMGFPPPGASADMTQEGAAFSQVALRHLAEMGQPAAVARVSSDVYSRQPMKRLRDTLGPETEATFDTLPADPTFDGRVSEGSAWLGEVHSIKLSTPENGAAASIYWNATTGEVAMISVDPALHRQGVATELYDYATKYAEDHGLVPPAHSRRQSPAGEAWAPSADERLAGRPVPTEGMGTLEARQARAAIEGDDAVNYITDTHIRDNLQSQLREGGQPEAPLVWEEVGRKPVKEPRAVSRWRAYSGRRRRILGDMERIQDEAYRTAPPSEEALRTESTKAVKQRPREGPEWMQQYRPKPSRRRVRGEAPWWLDEYGQRLGQSEVPGRARTPKGMAANRAKRLAELQKELDTVDRWLAKHPRPPVPAPSPRATRLRTRFNGQIVRLERQSGVTTRGGADWLIKLGDTEQPFTGSLAQALRKAEESAYALARSPDDQMSELMLRVRLSRVEERLASAPDELVQRVTSARETLGRIATEQGQLIAQPKPIPTRQQRIVGDYEPHIRRTEARIARMGGRGTPAELEGVAAPIREEAQGRILGLEGDIEGLNFQNERIGQMMQDLYGNRLPDPVNDWQQALDNAAEARAIHEQIDDYIKQYATRQRALDIVEKNARRGAPTGADLERVAKRQLRPEDAQGLIHAVDDINKWMANAGQVLPVGVRNRIEAALMSYEQSLAALTTTNDLPASALRTMQRQANDGTLPKVLKAQLRKGWREVGPNGEYIIDRELERAFFGVERTLDSKLFGPLFTTWTNFFKTYATLTPGFHVRNAISAIFMNATEGVGPRQQMRAIKLWNEYRAADNPVTWLAGRSKAEREAFEAVFASGAGGQFLEAGVGEARGGASRFTERLFANPATRLSKRFGEWVEGPQRLALGLHTTMAGGTASDALGRISRIHFDYGQVSKFDESMKRIIPFWTFMSRNIPLQFTQMWMRPKGYLGFQSFMRNLQLGNEDNPVIPDYITSAGGTYFGAKTPEWASKIPVIGPPAGMPIVLQPDLPHTRYADDLQRLTNALSGEGLGQMATNLNPLFTVPGEYISRTDFFTGQRFDKNDMVEVGGVTMPYAMALSLVGQAGQGADGKWRIDAAALNALRGLDPNLDRMMRLMPQATGLAGTDRTGASTNARQAESWARWLGAPVRTISPQQQASTLRNRAYKALEQQQRQAAMGG